MQVRASKETLSALVLLAQHGQAFETPDNGWKLKGTDEKIPEKRMNGLLILGYARDISTGARLSADGKQAVVAAIREGRLPASARRYVAGPSERRSVMYAGD